LYQTGATVLALSGPVRMDLLIAQVENWFGVYVCVSECVCMYGLLLASACLLRAFFDFCGD
jgi:hypothetical protein